VTGTTYLDLFAGIPVSDYARALAWDERLLGAPTTFLAGDTEAVWDLAAQRSVTIVEQPEHAGHAMLMILVDDLDAKTAEVAERGIFAAKQEIYPDGARKASCRDQDGNEFGFGIIPQ
jgi:predicted enzyme related to lactoylglutathione lyase